MSDDDSEGGKVGGPGRPAAAPSDGARKVRDEGAALEGAALNRLPPPAFPPGDRRDASRADTLSDRDGVVGEEDRTDGRKVGGETVGEQDETVGEQDEPLDHAFISPEDPIRKEGRGIPDAAFISPDDPLVPADRDQGGHVSVPGEHRARTSYGARLREKPTIHELPYLLDQLAERLQESGEKALEVDSEMGHFQASLRAFLKGYLEGSRG